MRTGEGVEEAELEFVFPLTEPFSPASKNIIYETNFVDIRSRQQENALKLGFKIQDHLPNHLKAVNVRCFFNQ